MTGGFSGSRRGPQTESSCPFRADGRRRDSQEHLFFFLGWRGLPNGALTPGTGGPPPPTPSPALFAKLCVFGRLHEPQFSQL